MMALCIAGCALLGIALSSWAHYCERANYWRRMYESECDRHDALLLRAQDLLSRQPALFAAVDAARKAST